MSVGDANAVCLLLVILMELGEAVWQEDLVDRVVFVVFFRSFSFSFGGWKVFGDGGNDRRK